MITGAVLAITLGSFVAAFVNAAFATGGVYIVLFTSISVLPVSAAIPLQSAFAAASLLARIHYFWAHIDWRLVRGFALGGILGVTFGTRTFVTLPETAITYSIQGNTVYIVEEDADGLFVRPRVVQTGAVRDGRIAVGVVQVAGQVRLAHPPGGLQGGDLGPLHENIGFDTLRLDRAAIGREIQRRGELDRALV